MKRHGNLWHLITARENIELAHKQARKGKTFYTEVKMVDADVETYVENIRQMLIGKTFTTSAYEVEDRFDGRKMRTIYKLPYYPDRIVQHALLNVIGPILVRSFIRDTYQSITGRGTSDAARRIKQVIRSENSPKYALKMDVKKYYPSVKNDILKNILRTKIKCNETLWLIDNIIDSIDGLPIGNYTSQHFGNVYLSGFDWLIKQVIRPQGYFRYCDDIVVLSDSKKRLVEIKGLSVTYLEALGLTIKTTWNIYDIEKQGIDFVGYVFQKRRTRLRKSIADNFKAGCKDICLLVRNDDPNNHLSSVMAYKGWAKPANAKRLWRKHTKPLITTYPKQLRSAL